MPARAPGAQPGGAGAQSTPTSSGTTRGMGTTRQQLVQRAGSIEVRMAPRAVEA